MNTVFRDTIITLYNGEEISASLRRALVKKREKDYLKFGYKGINISVSYMSDEADAASKIWSICRIVDASGTGGLDENGIGWNYGKTIQRGRGKV